MKWLNLPCCICGCKKTERHHVIPKLIADKAKIDKSKYYSQGYEKGRLVRICNSCHEEYEIAARELKKIIRLAFGDIETYVNTASIKEIEEYWKRHFEIESEKIKLRLYIERESA